MRKIVLMAATLASLAPGGVRAQDADHGKSVFARACASCHQVAKPVNLMGPHLIGVVGRRIGGVEGYNYSAALKAADGAWTPEALAAFIANPAVAMKGTKMVNRLPAEADRADVIAYLATVK